MNAMAALAMASATMAMPAGMTTTAMHSTCGQIVHPMYVSGMFRTEKNGNTSRPDHFAGETSPYRRVVKFSAGSFSVGDFAAIGSRPNIALVEDILVGAALLLQSVQTPMEREIQEIVSSKFESYWD